MVAIPMQVAVSQVTLPMSLSVECDLTRVDVYDGAVEVTPSADGAVLLTADKLVKSNITVNPIPSNYGLITWDGITLTVS